MTEIPWQNLSPEALNGLIESFVQREGTDYGAVEVSFAEKVQQVLVQIKQAKVLIVYDEETESVNLLLADQG